jgi:hypothetical protein
MCKYKEIDCQVLYIVHYFDTVMKHMDLLLLHNLRLSIQVDINIDNYLHLL